MSSHDEEAVEMLAADAPAIETKTEASTSEPLDKSGIEASAQQHLNIDDADNKDSALGGMTPQTSTMSVQSSVYNYVEENGRTYHRYKEGKYMLPNDEAEKDRLDLQHHLWMITLNDELVLAPIKKDIQNVLDIGTGTGIWAIEFANRFPDTKVIGSDLSPIQPEYSIPVNCHFEVDDAEDEWSYSQKFDLIHGRALVTCFKDPLSVVKSAFAALSPGGYLELQDMILPMRSIDNTINGTALESWTQQTMDAAGKMGTSWKNSANYAEYYREAGFVDIKTTHFQWPMNQWPKGKRMKTLGSYWQEDMLRGLESLSMAVLTRFGGRTREEVLELTEKVRGNIYDRKIHAYLPVVIVHGRKPLEGEVSSTQPA